jgi:hypothetical protein
VGEVEQEGAGRGGQPGEGNDEGMQDGAGCQVGAVGSACHQDMVRGVRRQVGTEGEDNTGREAGLEGVQGGRVGRIEQVNVKGIRHDPFYAIAAKKVHRNKG